MQGNGTSNGLAIIKGGSKIDEGDVFGFSFGCHNTEQTAINNGCKSILSYSSVSLPACPQKIVSAFSSRTYAATATDLEIDFKISPICPDAYKLIMQQASRMMQS